MEAGGVEESWPELRSPHPARRHLGGAVGHKTDHNHPWIVVDAERHGGPHPNSPRLNAFTAVNSQISGCQRDISANQRSVEVMLRRLHGERSDGTDV